MSTPALYDAVCHAASARVVRAYSTSFTLDIRLLDVRHRAAVRAIYGFVRFADEIVDSFHAFDKAMLLERFAADTHHAIAERISLNPILHSFQQTVHRYGIAPALIDAFLDSMRMDLVRTAHDEKSFATYVSGSAEAVGLMCLRVFCADDRALEERLAPAARRLGAAFQKVNFLRDLRDDGGTLGRHYFPNTREHPMDAAAKRQVEADIAADLQAALPGIRALPGGARLGVYVAYVYYRALFRKIQAAPVEHVHARRIRIPDRHKLALLTTSCLRYRLGLLG